MKFRTILADPPWLFNSWGPGGKGRSADQHYNCMTHEMLYALHVNEIAEKDCVLLLWATWPMLAEGTVSRLLGEWGFAGKTGFPWLKLSKDMLPRMGTGYHARACTEPLIIATKGSPAAPEPWERQEGVLFSKLGKHSAKPDDIYARAELYAGPFLEMFARPDGGLFPFVREGWTQIGNEITGRDIGDDLRLLAETEK